MNNYKYFENKFLIINQNWLCEYLKETKKYIWVNRYENKRCKIITIDDKEIDLFFYEPQPIFTKINKDELKNKTFVCMDKPYNCDIKKIHYVFGRDYGNKLIYNKIELSLESFNERITKVSKFFKYYRYSLDDSDEIEYFKNYITNNYMHHQEIKYTSLHYDILKIFIDLDLMNENISNIINNDIMPKFITIVDKLFSDKLFKLCPLCRCENEIDCKDDYKKLFVQSDELCCVCMDDNVNIKLPSCKHECLCTICFSKL